MCRSIHFAVIILTGGLIFGLASRAPAGVSDRFSQAKSYREDKQYDQAEQIYRQIIAQFPDSNDALEAQKQLTCLYIITGQQAEADAAFAELTAAFSGHKDIAQTVHNIAYQYRNVNRQEKANEVDQYVVGAWPETDCAVLAQMDIAKYYVDQGKDPNAQASVDKLLRDFSGNPLIARAVHDIAQHYRWSGKYEKANALYQHVVANWPDSEHALWSQADLIKSYLALGDDPNAEAAVEKLLANFTDNPLAARAVWDTAQHYRELKKYPQANRLYQHVVANWPDSEHALWSQADLVKSYLALEDNSNAEVAVQGLLGDFADNPLIARAVWDTAQYYRDLKKYAEAARLYEHVVANYPDSEHALKAQMDLVKSYLALEDDPNVETAIGGLLGNFSDNPLAATAVWEIGQHCRELKKYAQANRLYKHVVANCRDSERALWAQADLIKSYLALKDDPNAEPAVEKLLADFSDNPFISRAIHDTAYEYRKLEKYDKADQLDQFVINNWPGDEQAMWAKMDMAKTNILLGNDAVVEATIDNLIAGFNDHPDLPQALFRIGEGYYERAFGAENKGDVFESNQLFRKAVAIWERIVTELPESAITPQAYYFSARCRETLGELDYAANYYQTVIHDWPDYKFCDVAHFLLARCFEKLANSGSIPREEAAVMIRDTCEKLLADYPNSKIVKATTNLLEQWKSVKAQ